MTVNKIQYAIKYACLQELRGHQCAQWKPTKEACWITDYWSDGWGFKFQDYQVVTAATRATQIEWY